MKRTLFAFLFLFPVLLSAQFRIVGTGLFTTVNDSTYRAKIDFRPDLTGFSYNPTQMNDSMYVLSQRGQLYRLDSFYNATFSSAFIVVVEKNGNWGSPVGQVMVFQNNSSLAAPQAVYGANGATAGMQAGVDTWNALLLKVVADSASYWNEAYSSIVDSIWFSGTSTKTLNITQRGGDTLSASFVITGGADSLYVAENTGTTLLTNGDTLDLTDYPTMPFDSVTFNINEGDASKQELKYSAEKGYLQYGGLDSVQIPLLPGIWYVRNDTSVTIPKGTVVRASGTLGASGRIKVKHMIANGSIPAMYVLGIAMQDIAVGADGYVMTQGKIRKVNTQAYSAGAVLYADVDTLGGLTQTEPGNGYLKLPIAFVVHSASNGTLAVRIDPGSSLHDLHDVDTAGRVNGSVLRYDSALKYWKASTTAGIVAGDTSAMLTNYINIADTAAMLSSYISNADTSVFARDFQLSGTSGQVTYFNGSNTVTGDANLTWSAANQTLGINTTTTSGANIIIKNTQEPIRDAAWLPNQTFGADTTNWTRGTGWTFNGTQAVATAATGALTYTTLPDTIISGRAYEVTYTLASYSAGTVTVALGNATLALPQYSVTGNAVLLLPTSATGGFRFTTSTFTGRLDNIAVVEVRNPAPVLMAGQDDGAATLYNQLRMPNSSTIAFGDGGSSTTGLNNIFLGSGAGSNNTTGSRNIFLGAGAGNKNIKGGANVFLGSGAGNSNVIGNNNIFLGEDSGVFNNAGDNIFIGGRAGYSNITGIGNIFFGTAAGYSNISASYNFFAGSLAGYNNTIGNNNVFLGSNAGFSNTGGTGNFFLGNESGYFNTAGGGNYFFGENSGRLNKAGNNNFFFGLGSGRSNTQGSFNVFIGYQSGFNPTAADTLTGSNNIGIGRDVSRNINSNATGNLVLGNSLELPTGNGSNQVVIKNLIFGTGASGTGTTIQTTAKAGINVNNPQSTLDVEGNMAIGATYSGTTAAPTNGLIVEGNTGIGTSSPQRRLHITGTVRVDTLTRDIPTRIVGADADGDLAALTLGTGLSIASGTLNGPSVSGTTNYLPRFTGASSIGNSPLYNEFNNRVSHGHAGYSDFLSIKNAYHLYGNGSTADDQPIHFIEGNVGTTAAHAPQLRLMRSRATTVNGSAGQVQFGDYLGYLSFWPNENTQFRQASAYIAAVMDSITGSADFPTSIRFAVAPNGSEGAVERVTINNAGRVGIGTTSPDSRLTVVSSDSVSALPRISARFSDASQSSLYIAHPTGTSSTAMLIGNGQLGLATSPGAASGYTERVRVASDGKVGIGTTSPDRTLHINSTDALKLPAGLTSDRPSIGITGDLRMNTSPASDSLEYYNGASWVTVQDKLQNPVTGTGTANRLAKFTGTSSLGDSPIVLTGDTLITFGTAAPGLVTINTKDFPNTPGQMPYTKFKLNTGYGINGISMGDPSGPSYGTLTALQFTTYDGTASGGFDYWSTRLTGDGFGNFHISNSPANSDGDTVMTNRLSITATGKVGINKSAPDSTLDVTGSSRITGNTLINGKLGLSTISSDSAKVTIRNTNSTVPALNIVGNTNVNGVDYNAVNVDMSTVGVNGTYTGINVFQSASSDGSNIGYKTSVNARNSAYGVYSTATKIWPGGALFGEAVGVYGSATTTSGLGFSYGGKFENLATSGTGYGLYVNTTSAVSGSVTPFAVAHKGTVRTVIDTVGRVGIGTTSPSRTLHVEGEARISDLTTDTPTRIVGADADGDLGAITLGTGLSISSGTLNASGITSVYIPLNVFAIGDTLTTTVNSKEYFLVHSGLNGYCIDSYTVKAIAGTGTADIQLDKNGSGANLQAISGTTVYTKDTNIALVTGDYIRGQVSVTGGTLIGLGLTLEIKATCN